MRAVIGVALVAGLTLAACGNGDHEPAEPAGAGQPARSVERFVDRVLPKGASGTLVAGRGRKRVHCAGFGMANRKERLPAACDTVYDVMSMTKQFTAAAILKLEMMGQLRVTDRIGAHLGRVPKDKRKITLHQLLTHTSGLVDGLGGDYERVTRAEMVAGALDSRLRFRPGRRHYYSNLGYSLLAAIVERASGMGYEEFLAEHLFAPAGMAQTGYVLPKWRRAKVAVEYDAKGRPHGRPFDHPWAGDGPYWNLRGNGGLLSTARDMFRWHVALTGRSVLDRAAKRKLFHPYVLEVKGGDSYYGYGWVVVPGGDGRVVWHNGGNGWSFGMLTRLLKDRVMVFWITNRYRDDRRGWNMEELEPRLTEGVAKRLRGID
jgi:CubicO group peptidase (beta-lactamase class C family)